MIDSALFLDNTSTFIKNMKECGKDMHTRKIKSFPINKKDRSMEHKTIKAYRNKMKKEKNFYSDLIYELYNTSDYDNTSGIRKRDIQIIKKWVLDKKKEGKKHLAVLFDMDQTLTMFGGYYAFTHHNIHSMKDYMKRIEKKVLDYAKCLKKKFYGKTRTLKKQAEFIESIISYYAGGKERLKYLRKLFTFLREQGVAIFVVTNNSKCVENKGFVKDFLHQFFQSKDIKLICAKEYNYSKAEAISHQSKLKRVCTYKQKKSKKK